MGRSGSRRIHLLDEIRGFTVVLMVIYHLWYIMGYAFNWSIGRTLFDFFKYDVPLQPFFAGVFIFICGISCNLSHNNLKRGLLLAAAACLVSLVLWCATFWGILGPDNHVWFGILHLLATCILLYTLLRPTLRLIPPWIGVILSAVLLVFCWHVPEQNGGYFGIPGLFTVPVPMGALDTPWLYPLGLCPISTAADYFPLAQWFFCFLMGTYAGIWAKEGKFPKFAYRSHVPFLSKIGKYTIWIYLLHQPILYLLCFAVDAIMTAIF